MGWTSEQQKVIDLRNRDILVSAAAGSGKTAVLVERIIKLVTDSGNPVDIDRLLVVTFTRAAASEMRERIGAAIDRECEKNPDNAHLRRQSALIHNAMITTIDSFCLFVVRNHFEEIHLDPNFRIADEGEIRLLEQDILKKVFESQYALQQPEFEQLVDTYAGKRSDQTVRDMVGKIYKASLSSPWPVEWIKNLVKPYQVQTTEELLQTEMITDITENVKLLLLDMQKQLQSFWDMAAAPDGPQGYLAALEADIEQFCEVESLTDYRMLKRFFQNLKFKNLAPVRGFTGDAAKKEAVQNGRNSIKKEIAELGKKYFSMDLEEFLAQVTRLRPVAEELVRLALLYTEAMAEAKQRRRVVDFSDIEHFALRILVDEETKECKKTAEEFRAHFEEIMIDEYQDSNQVQEEIMLAVSRLKDGIHNMFMVGDVKQSIYRFRLARPELFMEKYAAFSTEDSLTQRIDLHKNFRSRKEVLCFCNDIFYKLMSPDLGRVAYNEEAALYPGADYQDDNGMQAELLLLDEKDEFFDDEKDLGKREIEAHLVAGRIHRLMGEMQVKDKESGQKRPLKYSDIVILFRSLKDWGTDFVKVLAEQGIPSYVESRTGYFSSMEVQTVLSMLRILDNPYQDIPMAAVLKSPMAGLDEEELAEIRVNETQVTFAQAAFHAMKNASEGTLAEFYQVYSLLRRQRDLPVHELIQKILDVTGYGNYAAALPAGKQRAANLDMLLEKAAAYEKSSYRGLFHFMRYIDRLQKYDIDFGEADTNANADVVRIMTIHKSKGLEFPVVFVSGLSKKFNQMDARDPLVLHPDLGMGFSEITGKPKVKKNCLFRHEIADRLQRENLGEELRVLYVALTRAKEKLILTGVVKDFEKSLSGFTGNTKKGVPVSYRQREAASCCLDWILPAMLSYPDKYHLKTVNPGELVFAAVETEAEKSLGYRELISAVEQAEEEMVKQYDTLFSYQYPHQGKPGLKSKYSVSELKHDSMVISYDRTEGEAAVPDFLMEEREIYIPDFARTQPEDHADSVSPAENAGARRGTAVHRMMECLDFMAIAEIDRTDKKAVRAFVKSEMERMLASGELTEEWYRLIFPPVIEGFVSSDVAARMASAALRGELYREKPFVMKKDDILIQGIIDVFWLEQDKIVLLDYKTDRVEHASELVLRYETQLSLYADALERYFSTGEHKKTAGEKLIYSFRLQEVVKIEQNNSCIRIAEAERAFGTDRGGF